MAKPFWQTTPLAEMTTEQWESLCDGCGKCCLHKLVDDDTDELYFTDVSCQLLCAESGSCKQYATRFDIVPDCVVISQDNLQQLYYLPNSCAYRRLAEGRSLPSWHPLRHQGSKDAMVAAGMSVVGRIINERDFAAELEDRIVTWPLQDTP